MSILTNSTLSVAPASSSRAGSIALHGPHHGAQKSTTTGRPACRTSCSNVSSVTARIGLTLPAEPEERHPPDRFEHDRLAHLRAAGRAVDERDRDLDRLEARALRPIRHLDLEGVALRRDRVEVDRLEHAPSEALEAACRILHAHP